MFFEAGPITWRDHLKGIALTVILCATIGAATWHIIALLISKPTAETVAAPTNQVSILTWWGYLHDGKLLNHLRNTCGVHLKLTEYMNVEELLSYAKNSTYDIYIYPLGYKNELAPHFPEPGAKLRYLSARYHPAIKHRYQNASLDHDTLFFQESISAFVYDTEVIQNLETLTAQDILNLQREESAVVLQAEYKQLRRLLGHDFNVTHRQLWDQLYAIATRFPNRFSSYAPKYERSDLVLGYLDIGELHNPAIQWHQLKKSDGSPKKIALGIHPKYSYITTDLLSLKSTQPAADCVARVMGDEPFLNWITQSNFYFSPFGHVPKDDQGNPISEVARDIMDRIHQLPWVGNDEREAYLSEHDEYARATWQKILHCLRNRKTGCALPERMPSHL